jgi:glycosyltransferase involved in cell wall biosynthesis
VRPGDNRDLADALAQLVLEPRLRRELGRKAAEGVRRHFGVERMARETAAVLAKLVEGASVGDKETHPVGVLSN